MNNAHTHSYMVHIPSGQRTKNTNAIDYRKAS